MTIRMARKGGRRPTSRVLAGTSTQYLSGPVPHVLRQSLVVLVCGPRGVGKSSVVRHMMQGATMVLRGEGLQTAASRAVRQKKWAAEVLNAERLVIDGPSFLRRRPGVRRLLGWLLKQRLKAGHRTVVIEGTDDSAMLLVDAVPTSARVTSLRPSRVRGHWLGARRGQGAVCRRAVDLPQGEAGVAPPPQGYGVGRTA